MPANSAPKLHDVQLTVAREQGFPSWPGFRTFIVQSGPPVRKSPARGFYVALVLGNWRSVENGLKDTPALSASRGAHTFAPRLAPSSRSQRYVRSRGFARQSPLVPVRRDRSQQQSRAGPGAARSGSQSERLGIALPFHGASGSGMHEAAAAPRRNARWYERS
jgi:hypothetical protein